MITNRNILIEDIKYLEKVRLIKHINILSFTIYDYNFLDIPITLFMIA